MRGIASQTRSKKKSGESFTKVPLPRKGGTCWFPGLLLTVRKAHSSNTDSVKCHTRVTGSLGGGLRTNGHVGHQGWLSTAAPLAAGP